MIKAIIGKSKTALGILTSMGVGALLWGAVISPAISTELEVPTYTPNPTSTSTVVQTPDSITDMADELEVPTYTPDSLSTSTVVQTPDSVTDMADLVQQVRAAVVRIESKRGTGTGVIFEADSTRGSAMIITNHHVIEDAQEIIVTVNDTSRFAAEVVGVDALRDLAVLEVCCDNNFQSLEFGNASDVRAGTTVLSIGYSSGLAGEATVNSGIVSATRYYSDKDRSVIQTNISINPGDSGGPLLSMSGQIIGINTYRITALTSGKVVQGVGFAVSEATISNLLPVLTSGTQVPALALSPEM